MDERKARQKQKAADSIQEERESAPQRDDVVFGEVVDRPPLLHIPKRHRVKPADKEDKDSQLAVGKVSKTTVFKRAVAPGSGGAPIADSMHVQV